MSEGKVSVNAVSTISDVVALYSLRGELHYGEGVTQAEHAVQCAVLADASGASDELVVASLLHDIGHLLIDPEDFSFDDRHEAAGASALSRLFGKGVSTPVALHVAAKRYLCSIDPTYQAGLSAASQKSLALQGGAYDREAADAFQRLAHWRDAVVLRRFDDEGKSGEATKRLFVDFVPLMRKVAACIT